MLLVCALVDIFLAVLASLAQVAIVRVVIYQVITPTEETNKNQVPMPVTPVLGTLDGEGGSNFNSGFTIQSVPSARKLDEIYYYL